MKPRLPFPNTDFGKFAMEMVENFIYLNWVNEEGPRSRSSSFIFSRSCSNFILFEFVIGIVIRNSLNVVGNGFTIHGFNWITEFLELLLPTLPLSAGFVSLKR